MERARRAFADGAEAEDRGDCTTAIARFEEVIAVKETPAVRLRIGRCHEKLGQLRAAQRDYERAKELAQGEPQAMEVAAQVSADLAKRIPRIQVVVTGAPGGIVVKVDDVELPAATRSTAVDPGRHRVTASAAGYLPFDQSFEVAEGGSRSLTITLRPLDGPAPPLPPPPIEEAEETFPWLPVALYGGGAIAIGVGIPLLITSISDDSALDEECFDASGGVSADRDPCLRKNGTKHSAAEQADITSQRDSINTRQIIGWTLIGVGAAAAGVATVLLVTDSGDLDEEAALVTTPIVGPGFVGWSASGRF